MTREKAKRATLSSPGMNMEAAVAHYELVLQGKAKGQPPALVVDQLQDDLEWELYVGRGILPDRLQPPGYKP